MPENVLGKLPTKFIENRYSLVQLQVWETNTITNVHRFAFITFRKKIWKSGVCINIIISCVNIVGVC